MSSNSSEATQAYQDMLEEASCYPWTPEVPTSYGYVPSFAAGVIFSILFAIGLLYHITQSIRLRATISLLMAMGALTELIGWAARAYAGKCPYNGNAFLTQIVTLIIAPVFFSAALYVLLGQLILSVGRASSVITAKWYAIIFCTCDLISLIAQAVGGAMASEAETHAEQTTGTNIMVAGIAFQLFTMTLFGGFMADFYRRVVSRRGPFLAAITRGMRLVFIAALVSFVMIYVRGIYRTIELAQGWTGYLITHEGYFIGLDAVVMVIAVGAFAVVDPAVIFSKEGRSGFSRKMHEKKGSGNTGSGEESNVELAPTLQPVGRY